MDSDLRYVVVDSSVLATALLPTSHSSVRVQNRSSNLIEAIVNNRWPSVRLCTASVCITETQGILDKFRFCTWHGENRRTKKVLSKSRYDRAVITLRNLLKKRAIETIHLEHDHVLAASLISPINQKYQIKRRTKKKGSGGNIKPPMGGVDCAIIGSAIMLGLRVGVGNVVVATADRRMSDTLDKARSLTGEAAKQLGLHDNASRLGMNWSNSIYPLPANLFTASNDDLRRAFQAWPLPKRNVAPVLINQISNADRDSLIHIYLRTLDLTRVGVDKLPYSREINHIRASFANMTGKYLTNHQIYRALSGWRKAGVMKAYKAK